MIFCSGPLFPLDWNVSPLNSSKSLFLSKTWVMKRYCPTFFWKFFPNYKIFSIILKSLDSHIFLIFIHDNPNSELGPPQWHATSIVHHSVVQSVTSVTVLNALFNQKWAKITLYFAKIWTLSRGKSPVAWLFIVKLFPPQLLRSLLFLANQFDVVLQIVSGSF